MQNEQKSKQVICANCGGSDLQAVVENDLSSQKDYNAGWGCLGFFLFGPIGFLFGSTKKITNRNRNYWVCKSCGNKFRNAFDLREEQIEVLKFRIKESVKNAILSGLISLPLIYFAIKLIPQSTDNNEFVLILIPGLLLLVICILCILAVVFSKKKLNALLKEPVL